MSGVKPLNLTCLNELNADCYLELRELSVFNVRGIG